MTASGARPRAKSAPSRARSSLGDEGDGGVLARGLELAGEDAAEEAFDDRAAEGPQVVAAGAGAVEAAEQVALRRDRVRLGEREEDLVGEAEAVMSILNIRPDFQNAVTQAIVD